MSNLHIQLGLGQNFTLNIKITTMNEYFKNNTFLWFKLKKKASQHWPLILTHKSMQQLLASDSIPIFGSFQNSFSQFLWQKSYVIKQDKSYERQPNAMNGLIKVMLQLKDWMMEWCFLGRDCTYVFYPSFIGRYWTHDLTIAPQRPYFRH